MIRFSGQIEFPYPRTAVCSRLTDATFLAGCAPGATIHSATVDAAAWTAPSPFRVVSSTIESTLTIHERRPESLEFVLVNRIAGALLNVKIRFVFADSPAGVFVEWSAEILTRTGLLKIVPPMVLRSQIEAQLGDLWRGVETKLAQELS
jgi:carbon monoxide dehydrogenase subunit G